MAAPRGVEDTAAKRNLSKNVMQMKVELLNLLFIPFVAVPLA